VSGSSQDQQWANLMSASGQLPGRLRAVSRGRRHSSRSNRLNALQKVQYQGVKFQALPWGTRVLIYGVVYGLLVALLEPYKPPSTPLRNGLIAGVVFIVLVGPVMRWSSRRKAKKAAGAAEKSNSAVA